MTVWEEKAPAVRCPGYTDAQPGLLLPPFTHNALCLDLSFLHLTTNGSSSHERQTRLFSEEQEPFCLISLLLVFILTGMEENSTFFLL